MSLLIKLSKIKCCALDLVPTSVFSGCLPVLLQVITKIVNCSLADAFMPAVLKNAVITPLLRKSKLKY